MRYRDDYQASKMCANDDYEEAIVGLLSCYSPNTTKALTDGT